MKKEVKCILVKLAVFAVITIIASAIINGFTPVITNDIAMQQLNGGDYGFMQMSVYNKIKSYSYLGYCVFFLIMFASNIKRAIKQVIENQNK